MASYTNVLSDKTYTDKIVMGSKRLVVSHKSHRDFHNHMEDEVVYDYYVTVIKAGSEIEMSTSAAVYYRWAKGVTADLTIRKREYDDGRVWFWISEVKLDYSNGVPTAEIAEAYINDHRKKLDKFLKNKGRKTAHPQGSNFSAFIAVGLIFLALFYLLYVKEIFINKGNYENDPNSIAKMIICIQIIVLIIVYYAKFSRSMKFALKRIFVLISLGVMIATSVMIALTFSKMYYFLAGVFGILFAAYFIFSLTQGFDYCKPKTKIKFEVVDLLSQMDGYLYVVFAALDQYGHPFVYPYCLYRTADKKTYAKGQVYTIDMQKVTSLNLNLTDPEFWFYDISYINQNDIVLSNTGHFVGNAF